MANEPANCIIEESEDLNGNRMAAVTDSRGGEYIVNIDHAVILLVQLLSNLANERRGGWTLNSGWYEGEIAKLSSVAVRSAQNG